MKSIVMLIWTFQVFHGFGATDKVVAFLNTLPPAQASTAKVIWQIGGNEVVFYDDGK